MSERIMTTKQSSQEVHSIEVVSLSVLQLRTHQQTLFIK